MHNQNILKKIRDIHFSFSEFAACCPELLKLKEIPQNAEYHAEGDVYRHTEMVCEKLVELSEWEQLESEEQEILFLSAANKSRSPGFPSIAAIRAFTSSSLKNFVKEDFTVLSCAIAR